MNMIERSTLWRGGAKQYGPTPVKYLVGIRIGYSAIANQLLELMRQLLSHPQVQVIALVTEAEYIQQTDWYHGEFTDLPLFVYSSADSELLSKFDFFFCPESNSELYFDLPQNVLKVGCPHGVDIPLAQTVNTYGGGYCFDYILSAIYQEKGPSNQFFSSFPVQWRNHNRPYVCEIPFGFPKLDAFIKQVQQSKHKKRAIIYHLSYLAIEQTWVYQLILPVLECLLTNYPDYDVVFRPHHLDRQSSWVQDAVEFGKRYPNFVYSESDSYIEEYARGALMLCHRSYKLHLFSLATAAPSVVCIPDNITTIPVKNVQFIECQFSNLTGVINAELIRTENSHETNALNLCEQAGIYYPGQAVNHLISQFDNMLADRPQPEWNYFPLNTAAVDARQEVLLNLLSIRPANMTFLAMMAQKPHWLLASLLAADSYSRSTSLQFYYFRIGLNIFQQLVSSKVLPVAMVKICNFWWLQRGKSMLKFIEGNLIANGETLTKPECWLQSYLHEQSSAVDVVAPALFELTSQSWLAVDGPVTIYGAGEISKQFIDNNVKSAAIEVEAIVDSNPSKWGTDIKGFTVVSAKELSSDVKQIVIGSHAFVPQIFHQLRSSVNRDIKIFAICPDRVLQALINQVLMNRSI